MGSDGDLQPLLLPLIHCPEPGCSGTVTPVALGFDMDCLLWCCTRDDGHWWDGEAGREVGVGSGRHADS